MNPNLTLEWLGSLALRGSVLLAVVLAVGLLLRRVSAGQRYGLWLAALLGLIGLPALLSWGPAWRVLPNFDSQPFPVTEERVEPIDWEPVAMPPTPRVVEALSPTRLPASPVMVPPVTPTAIAPAPPFDWSALIAWLPLLWFFGVTAGLAGLLVSLGRLRRLRGKQPPTELASLHEIAQELGLHRTPRLVLGKSDAVPMVWGVWHPCLLLPQGFQDWSQPKLRAVLLHELAHLVRRDPLALMLGQFARVLHWFNPLAWLTLNQMRADQERACDDTVLRHGVRASDYAQVLLDLSQQRRPVAGLSWCALAMARPGPVEQRLVAILDGKCSRASATPSWRLLWTALILTVALPLALLHAVESAKVRGQIVDRNGVVLAKTKADGLRVYPQKDLAAHVVGYVSINRVKDNAIVGSDGIEKSFHETLSKGTEVRLTLDARLQRRAEVELQTSQQNGAVVMVDVATGELLALASWPSYDLNHAVPILELAVFQKWAKDPAKPLFPRATFAQYPPGGPFKAVTALAGFSAGHGNAVFHCEPQLKIGERYFHNHSKSDIGEFDLERAIVRSHNVYFYQLALKMGHEPLAVMAAKLGFGEKTGLSLATEAAGNIPTFLLTGNRHGKSITGGDIANLSIGQGETLATPVQMARMAALIASRGKSPGLVLVQGETGLPATDLGVSPEDWDLLHRAMRCDVPRSVSERGASEHVSIAMMTGTSQWNIRENKNLAQLIGFAPVENPQVAFAVVLEGRPGQSMSGSGMAAPVAKRIVEQYLGLPVSHESPSDATQPAPQSEDGEAAQQANDAKPSAPSQDQDDRLRNWTPIDEERPSADTVRRWELLRDEGMLGDLPKGARGLISRLKGSWPRQVEVRFVAPEKEVLSWLEFSPGRVRHQNFLYPVANDSLLATSQSQTTININGVTYMVSNRAGPFFRSSSNQDWHEDWKRVRGNIMAGRIGYLGSMQGEQGISVSLSKRQEAEIEVTITRPQSRPPRL